jgi:hypothetical protein
MPPTDHQQHSPMAATAHARTLAGYRVENTDRRLVAVHVPGEPTARILDVLATPPPDDDDIDPIEIEPACPPDEAQAVADDYARLAGRKGWIPMRWGWF